ncbi:hypothetical protein ACFRAR_06645 [Kitasatospora sp. NPDC056651]|uniref:hypothetical protein n=1 Tax=Kitasatospora sp. NPDC056651 TaxID=3345892 RepID=UPI0036B75EB7
MRSKIAKVSLVGIFSAAAITTVAPSAFAGGTSGTTNGCYSTWGNTGSNAHCTNPVVTVSGYYQNFGSCSYSSDQYSTRYFYSQGSAPNNWGQVDCTFSISYSRVNYG